MRAKALHRSSAGGDQGQGSPAQTAGSKAVRGNQNLKISGPGLQSADTSQASQHYIGSYSEAYSFAQHK